MPLLMKLSKRDTELSPSRSGVCHHIELLSFLQTDHKALRVPLRLRYFREPKPKNYPLDLTDGIDFYTFQRPRQPNEVHQKLERYLMTIWSQCDESRAEQQQLKNVQIFTDRQTLQRLMLTPYRQELDWSVIATKFDGRIFLNLRHKNGKQDNDMDKKVRRALCYKFDTYCFSDYIKFHLDSPRTTPMSDDPVDENNQLYAILRIKLGNISILYSADVPGVTNRRKIKNLLSKRQLSKCRFVLTKVLRPTPIWRRRRWTLDWAAQAYLSRCASFCVAFYDGNGHIRTPIEHHSLRSIIELQTWNLCVCFNFLQRLLKRIRSVIDDSDTTRIVHEFTFNAAELSISYQQHEAKGVYACISEEFIKFTEKFKL